MEPANPPVPTAPESPTGKRVGIIRARERAIQAMELRRAGWSYETIARRLGYKSPSGAYGAIRDLLKRTAQESSDEVRSQELARLDRLFAAVWPRAIGANMPGNVPDLNAMDRCLAIMRQRAQLLGLNAPVAFDVRAFVLQMAEADRLSDDEKRDAVEFVEHHLKEWRPG